MANLPDARTWTVDNLVINTQLTIGPGATTLGTLVVGAETVTSLTTSGPITFTAASSVIIPGATQIAFRNNANSTDNVIIGDAGTLAVRSDVSVGGRLTFSTAVSKIVPGATSISLRN